MKTLPRLFALFLGFVLCPVVQAISTTLPDVGFRGPEVPCHLIGQAENWMVQADMLRADLQASVDQILGDLTGAISNAQAAASYANRAEFSNATEAAQAAGYAALAAQGAKWRASRVDDSIPGLMETCYSSRHLREVVLAAYYDWLFSPPETEACIAIARPFWSDVIYKVEALCDLADVSEMQSYDASFLAHENAERAANSASDAAQSAAACALFTTAETSLPGAYLVNFSPIDKFSVVTGSAARSGGDALKLQTVDNGTTYAERTIVGPAVVKFAWRVSSESNFDFFSYSLDGVELEKISGNGEWLDRSLTLGAGSHALRWAYAKDVDSANFDDAGYLDDLVILPAYTDLQVSRLGKVLSGSSTLDFGTVQQEAAEVTQELDLKNNGTAPMEVAASLPNGCGLVFDTDEASIVFTLGAGEETIVSLKLQTAVAGAKSALLAIEGTDSQTAAPAITLSGNVQAIAPILGCSWSGGALTNGQDTAVDFGTTPSDRVFTISNTGQAALTIASLSVSPTTDFQVIAQPAASVAVNGSTTFTLRALEGSRGSHSATVTIVSNDGNAPNFSFPVTSESYLAATGTSFVSGSFTNTGTSAGWSNAAVTLASGSSGQALKTGSTPDNGDSTIGATFDGPGLLSWNWQVSSQANYDWLVCEVNGVEVAGISVKTAAWQSQVVQIPAGSQVRWIYRKDGSNFSGADTGYLSDIYFSKFAALQNSFSDWSAANGNLAPTQLIPAGGMQAMFAWLGGVDTANGPSAGQYKPSVSGGFYKYRYTVAKAAAGIVQPQISTDLVTWNSRKMKQTLISEDETSAVVELSVPTTGKVFSRMATEMQAYTVPAPAGFALIPAGSFMMGDALDGQSSLPVHTVNVSAFYMAKNLVTKADWDTVRTWAVSNGYTDLAAGNGKAFNHPVQTVTWWDGIKYCNARSQKEGLVPVYTVGGVVMKTGTTAPTVNWTANGYRLPTEAEWEKAARGGLSGKRFPWGDTITQNQANYYSFDSNSYDINPTRGYPSNFSTGLEPYTSPVGSFASNGYGLNDMAGNVWQWCWDWGGDYDITSPTDPHGANSGSTKVIRGSSWYTGGSYYCRVAFCYHVDPSSTSDSYTGFRVARSSVTP
jgi:formylglycine-generating enzyme required for sulfatase activity